MMNGYKAFYNSKTAYICAATSYEAQTEAAKHFKVTAKNQYKVDVYLCERADGSQVVTTLTN